MATLNIPKTIAHRGAKGYAPENSLSAIHTAADMGTAWISIDVKLTKDSVPIAFHDEELDRLTDSTGVIAETDWDTLQTLDYGTHFSESYVGEPIPSFEQALDIILERNLGLNLNIKSCAGREEETAEVALDILSRSWDEPQNILISSSKPESLDIARHYLEAFPRSLILNEPHKDWEDLATQLEISAIQIANTPALANEFTIKQFQTKSYKVLVNTVNEPQSAQELFNLGVDSLLTDYPDLLD